LESTKHLADKIENEVDDLLGNQHH
jgi:hypothetical protein